MMETDSFDLIGRVGKNISQETFKEQCGKEIPLVWSHHCDIPVGPIGYSIIKNMPDGTYVYCTFNESLLGIRAKKMAEHGDYCSFSILFTESEYRGSSVQSGIIKEISLVVSGYSPGKFIEPTKDGLILYTGEVIR